MGTNHLPGLLMTSLTTLNQSWATPETGTASPVSSTFHLLLIFIFSPNFFLLLLSPGFLRFVRVLCGMSSDERKAFLQFTTGCSTLPPGGLANLHPRLTIVRKVVIFPQRRSEVMTMMKCSVVNLIGCCLVLRSTPQTPVTHQSTRVFTT